MTKEIMIAGPAYCAAARPVRTKIPVPMMQPMPSRTRLSAPRERFNSLEVNSLWIIATDLRWKIRAQGLAGMRRVRRRPYSQSPELPAAPVDSQR